MGFSVEACLNTWQSLEFSSTDIALANPETHALRDWPGWMNWLHGFAAKPISPLPWYCPVLIRGAAPQTSAPAPEASRRVFETDCARVVLRSGAPACLTLKAELPIGEVAQLLPLTAALAQQWLLAGTLSLHAAVFLLNGKGILAIGHTYAGKSRLVQSALALGARVVSDDLVRIAVVNGRPVAHCLRGFLRFRGPNSRLDAAEAPDSELRWLRAQSAQFLSALEIDAVLCLERPSDSVRPALTVLAPITRLEATARLIDQSAPLFLQAQFPIERVKLLAALNCLLDGTPILRATTGLDLLDAPEQVFASLHSSLFGAGA
jgi:hypothetical protein